MSNYGLDQRALGLLKEIQAYEFAAIDLNLFLDTHPNEQRALADYNALTNHLTMLKKQYEQIYGPMVVFRFTPSQYPWRWIDGPWPWEIEY
jgi:spore coat protein JB